MFKRLILVFFLGYLVACSPPQNDQDALVNRLTINLGGKPSLLNPILLTDSPSHSVVSFVFSSLLKRNPDLEMEPDLAESYTVSPDGLTYTFKLRRDVSWHDGAPFTAEDVKFTFDKIVDPKTNTVRRSHYVMNGKPVQWEIIDTHTIKAMLPQSYSPFKSVLNMEILPKHLLEDQDINTTSFNRQPIGTGPFKFKEWKTGQYLRLVKNDRYHKGAPKLDEFIMKIIPDTNTALAALEKGELDVSGIPEKDAHRFQDNPKFNFYRYYGLDFSYLGLNIQRGPLKNLAVRRAIAHAINKPSIIKSVMKGFGRPAHIPSSPVSWAYPDEKEIYKYDYAPEKSTTLLEEEGYKKDAKTGIYTKDGQPISLDFLTVKGSPTTQRIAQMIQQYLKQVGIEVNIQIMEWSAFLKVLHADKDPKDFDIVMLGWRFDINDPDDSYTLWNSKLYPKGANLNGYSNPRVDMLLEKGRVEQNQEARKVIYKELFNHISKDLPYVFLFHSQSGVAVYKHVEGLSKPGPGGILNRVEKVWINK